MSLIGDSCPRSDAMAKVCGEARYTVDYEEPGMLYGHLLRSTVQAGKITRLDISKAAGMPGVRAVVTAAEAPGLAGMLVRDQPVFAIDRVRYEGETDRGSGRRYFIAGESGSGTN